MSPDPESVRTPKVPGSTRSNSRPKTRIRLTVRYLCLCPRLDSWWWKLVEKSRGLVRIQFLVRSVREELFGPVPTRFRRTVRNDTSDVRDSVVNKLIAALNETERIAKAASNRPKKGSGGIPGKARWYQLMTAIAQTLDQVLRSVDLDQIQEKIFEMEKTIDELQRTTPKTG